MVSGFSPCSRISVSILWAWIPTQLTSISPCISDGGRPDPLFGDLIYKDAGRVVSFEYSRDKTRLLPLRLLGRLPSLRGIRDDSLGDYVRCRKNFDDGGTDQTRRGLERRAQVCNDNSWGGSRLLLPMNWRSDQYQSREDCRPNFPPGSPHSFRRFADSNPCSHVFHNSCATSWSWSSHHAAASGGPRRRTRRLCRGRWGWQVRAIVGYRDAVCWCVRQRNDRLRHPEVPRHLPV